MGKHKGMYNYNSDESGALALGQLGFNVVTATGNVGDSGNKSGDYLYVAIKAVGADGGSSTDNIDVTAESLHGDDLSNVELYPGDIIWGCFNYVNIVTNGSNKMKLLVYNGK